MINEALIKKIFKENDAGEVQSIVPMTGGLVSPVYDVGLSDGHYKVIKFRTGEKAYNALLKEKWCSDQVITLGVPTVNIRQMGEMEDGAWCIQDKIEGVIGEELSKDEHVRIAHHLGQMAAKINTVKTYGCGFHLDDKPPHHFLATWEDAIDWSVDWIFENDILVETGTLNHSDKKICRDFIDPMRNWSFEPCLAHADMFARNTIVSDDGTVHLIDWGSALGHRAPVSEIGFFFAYCHEENEQKAFLDGYGISHDDFLAMKQDIFRVAMIEVLGCVVWGYENNMKKLPAFIDNAQRHIANLKSDRTN